MKKVGLLTFHKANNYGAFLQAYALRTYLNGTGRVQADFVNYDNENIGGAYKPSRLLKYKGNFLKKVAVFVLLYRDIKKRNVLFERFQREKLNINGKELSRQELNTLNGKFDMFIAGSDQVWNDDLTNNDTAYFLDFVGDGAKKYSYAASIGKSLNEEGLEKFKSLLADFDGVSLREQDSVDELKGAGIDCRLCVDPVFLLGKDRWKEFSQYKERKDYVLFFMMGNSKTALPAMEFAKKQAEKSGLDIVYLADREKWYKYRDLSHFGVADPSEFVGLIENAKLVVTNSFHATAFSVILQKDFFVETQVMRNNRILGLLEMCGLESRGLVKGKSAENAGTIDWDDVQSRLDKYAESSKEYLEDITGDF